MAGIRCKIQTTDLDYPKTQESKTFALLWSNMFSQSLNEFNFMADQAGIKGEITPETNHLYVQIDGYVDNIENYVSEYFSKMQSFQVDE